MKQTANNAYDHIKEHGKKVFHFKVAKLDISYFNYLASHMHKLKLDAKYFRKFSKFTATLGNKAPMSNYTCLRCCIQSHLNYHLSSTCVTINGIDTLDTLELDSNPVNGKLIGHFYLWDPASEQGTSLPTAQPTILRGGQRSHPKHPRARVYGSKDERADSGMVTSIGKIPTPAQIGSTTSSQTGHSANHYSTRSVSAHGTPA